jgi:hypothetical protein
MCTTSPLYYAERGTVHGAMARVGATLLFFPFDDTTVLVIDQHATPLRVTGEITGSIRAYVALDIETRLRQHVGGATCA